MSNRVGQADDLSLSTHLFILVSQPRTALTYLNRRKLRLYLLLLIGTLVALLLSSGLTRPHMHLDASDLNLQPVVTGLSARETNDQGDYYWTQPGARLLLDGFWGRPALLDLRLTSPRPAAAPPATVSLYSGTWESLPFLVQGDWRRYQVLIPPVDRVTQKVGIDVVPFTPSTSDRRRLGVALSAVTVTLPTVMAGRVPTPGQILPLVPLPLLLYILIQRVILQVAPTQARRHQRLLTNLTLAVAIAMVGLVAYVVAFPTQTKSLIPALWLLLIMLVGTLCWPRLWPRYGNSMVLPVISAWTRTDYMLAFGLAAGGVLTRLLLLPAIAFRLDGDDYLVGVFALNILQGYHALYYKEVGTLSSYLIAPVLAVTGPSFTALLVLPFVLNVILIITLYGLGRDLFDRWGGIAAAGWMILPSSTTMFWSFKLQPGYLDAITCAALALWGTVHLFYDTPSPRKAIGLMIGTALAVMLATWVNLVVVSILVACGMVILTSWWSLMRLPRSGYILATLIVIILGLLLVVPAHTHANHDSVHVGLSMTKLQAVMYHRLPRLIGIIPPLGDRPALPVASLLTGLTAFALVGTIIQSFRKRDVAAMIVIAITIMSICAATLSNFFTAVRYFLPFAMLAVPLLFAVTTKMLRHTRYGTIWVNLLFASVIVSNTFSSFGSVDIRTRHYDRPEETLAQALTQEDIRYLYTSYWIGMGTVFESGNTLAASMTVGANPTNYVPHDRARVEAANGVDTALVFYSNSQARSTFETYLQNNAISCTSFKVQIYSVYHQCTPFPNTNYLTRYLPNR